MTGPFSFDWNAIIAIANVLFLLSVLYAAYTLRESKRSRMTSILIWAASEIDSIRKEISIVRRSDRDFQKWSEEEIDAAAKVASRFQRLSYMARNKLINKKHLKRMWGGVFVEMWDKLAEFIIDKRAKHTKPINSENIASVDFERIASEFNNAN